MKTDIEELKRLAEANYGWRNAGSAWPHESGDGAAVVGNVDDSHEPAIRNPVAVVDVTQYDGFQDDSMQLAQFYAAANPAAVLELIRQREELLAALKESQSVSVNFWVSCQRDVVEKCMCAGCIEDRVQEAIAKAEG